MIDTICLLIPKEKILTLDLTSQGVKRWDLNSRTEQYEKFVRNPSKDDLALGLYFPRLTEYKRNNLAKDTNIRIEFSAPKLLFLNNLDELEEKDFQRVVEALKDRLGRMGIVISKADLENASVSSVHFSKNIQLEDGYTAEHLISEMNKVNLRKCFDFARARYIEGQSLYAHTTSHQLVIYDKVADLNKDKKRAIDKDQTKYQLTLFDQLIKKDKELIEVIRFEVRLSQKQKMNSVLEHLGCVKNPTFRDVFNVELSKKVLNDYWKKLIRERNLGLFSLAISLKDILRTLFIADRKIKPNKAIYLVGLFMLGKDENGMRELRSIVSKKSHERTWYRIVADMHRASEIITKNRVRDWVTQIDKKLENYQPLKIKINEK